MCLPLLTIKVLSAFSPQASLTDLLAFTDINNSLIGEARAKVLGSSTQGCNVHDLKEPDQIRRGHL